MPITGRAATHSAPVAGMVPVTGVICGVDDALGLGLAEGEGEAWAEVEGEGEGEADGLALGVAVALADTLELGLALGLELELGELVVLFCSVVSFFANCA